MEQRRFNFFGALSGSLLISFILTVFQVALIPEARSAEKPMARTVWNRVEGAVTVGSDQCLMCHDGIKTLPNHKNCESCHGPGSKHLDNPGRETISFPSPEICLSCHRKEKSYLTGWETSTHKKAGLACFDCHEPHGDDPAVVKSGRLRNSRIIDKCVSCHKEKKARMNMPYHHPMREGVMACTDCHNPHEDRSLSLVKMSERCGGCHQEQQGPWTYEHAPVTEDCTICHNPHGTVNPGLLKVAQPFLCMRCHTLAATRHGVSATGNFPAASIYKKCTGCHGAQHGSHQDSHLRY